MTAQAIVKKYRRAIRNRTGATFTHEQLMELARYGVLETLLKLEVEELCPGKNLPTSSETTGLINGETEPPPKFGKLPPMPPKAGKSFIEALVGGN